MLKPLIFALFTNFSLVEYTVALNCFTTDIEALQETKRVFHGIRNCDSYIDDMKKRFKLAGINKEDPLRCYTMNVNTYPPASNFVIKGCVPEGHCDKIVKPLVENEAQKRSVSIDDLKCSECVDNECNSFL